MYAGPHPGRVQRAHKLEDYRNRAEVYAKMGEDAHEFDSSTSDAQKWASDEVPPALPKVKLACLARPLPLV